ncbi:outer membrane protein assembly factor BamE [Roseateles paludis]|uniref:Outer membrane protein assembly factor BamE n=1 Tax=Roseateles paludis TaxID=3145238 RepID=A0ABV0FZF4_9BURK
MRIALLSSTLLLLGGCSSLSLDSLPSLPSLPTITGDKVLGFITPYRVEVVQGNVITKELAGRIKPGMPKGVVRDMLGTPLLTDAFHADRWDYTFTIARQGAAPQKRVVVAVFDGDKLKALEAPDDLPTEREFVASINTYKPGGKPPRLDLDEAERSRLPKPAKSAEAAPTAAAEGVAPGRVYPPLEAKAEPRS